MRFTHGFMVLFTFTVLISFVCCSPSKIDSAESEFGNNAYYFMALNSINQGNETLAVKYLKQGERNSTPLLARRCKEMLSTIGTVSERINAATDYYQDYPDEKSLLRLVQELTTGEEYSKIISLTEKLSSDVPAELKYLRFKALAKKNRVGYAGEIEDWFFHTTLTSFHKKFFEEYSKNFLAENLSPETITQVEFRLAVYNYNYTQAFGIISKLLSFQNNPAEWLANQTSFMLSDIGKTFVYGNTNFTDNARICDAGAAAAENHGLSQALFYLRFYAGRLYDKSSAANAEIAMERFHKAMEAAPEPTNYDNALWYYFSTALKISTERVLQELNRFAPTIWDAWYYSDFFDTLSQRLLSSGEWQAFFSVYQTAESYMDSETRSKYAYICGRLIEQNVLHPHGFSKTETQNLALKLFSTAYEPGGLLYYRIMASERLNLQEEQFKKHIYDVLLEESKVPDPEMDLLMAGYIAFNLPEEIYPEWQENNSSISLKTTATAAEFLTQQNTLGFSVQALRMMSNSIYHADSQPEEWMYRMVFPRIFAYEISLACGEFGLSEPLFFGLVRSESFFDPVVSSSKGAIGLTQLMPSTAGDVARKLKLSDYDLEDSTTNLRIGAFYLEEQIRLFDGSVIEGLFSYNAGRKRVLNWKDVSTGMPKDLFLEVLPFAETREYGRKVSSAATMYGILYYGKSPSVTIQEIFGSK